MMETRWGSGTGSRMVNATPGKRFRGVALLKVGRTSIPWGMGWRWENTIIGGVIGAPVMAGLGTPNPPECSTIARYDSGLALALVSAEQGAICPFGAKLIQIAAISIILA
jgi:hypothetical protein